LANDSVQAPKNRYFTMKQIRHICYTASTILCGIGWDFS